MRDCSTLTRESRAGLVLALEPSCSNRLSSTRERASARQAHESKSSVMKNGRKRLTAANYPLQTGPWPSPRPLAGQVSFVGLGLHEHFYRSEDEPPSSNLQSLANSVLVLAISGRQSAQSEHGAARCEKRTLSFIARLLLFQSQHPWSRHPSVSETEKP